MKNEIMQKIIVVLNALNSIPVNGKQNLANLSGSIAVIEEIADLLENSEITKIENDGEEQ